jgi:hypothetical protein
MRPRPTPGIGLALMALALLSFALPARAQWTQNGVPYYSSGSGAIVDAQPHGAGGMVILAPFLGSSNTYGAMDILGIDAEGVPRWAASPANSPFIYPGSGSIGFVEPAMAAMTNGDVYVGWGDYLVNPETFQSAVTPMLQRLAPDKSVPWGYDALRLFPGMSNYATYTRLCAGNSGDVIAAAVEYDSVTSTPWRLRLQRVLADSTRAWGPAGAVLAPVSNVVREPHLEPDGAGGAFVLWTEYDDVAFAYQYRVQRLSAAGAPQWPAGGVLAFTVPNNSPQGSLASDGAGGLYVIARGNPGSYLYVQAQRLTAAGARLYGTDGVELAGPATSTAPYSYGVAADAQGLRLAWIESGSTLQFRRYASADGAPAFAPATTLSMPGFTSAPQTPCVVACANGETTVLWSHQGAGGGVFAQRVGAAGAILWNLGGVPVATNTGGVPNVAYLSPDGSDGVYATFNRLGGSAPGLYAMRIDADGDLRMLSGTLTAAADIPADQGGALALGYRAPTADAGFVQPEITGYNVWRLSATLPAAQQAALAPASLEDATRALAAAVNGPARLTPAQALRLRFPPGTWESLGFNAAVLDTAYRFVVATVNDSGPAHPGADETYVVTAHTPSPSSFGISNALAGHSRDNLAPAAPQQLAGAVATGAMHLSWAANGESDLGGYHVYRGASAGFVPSPASLLASVGTPAFVDPAYASGSWYKVTALDWNGNESAVTTLAAGAVTDAGPAGGAHVNFLRLSGANPAAGEVAVEFGLAADGPARITVLDAQGRVAGVVASGSFAAGAHRLAWDRRGADGRALHPGLFFVRIETPGFEAVRKLVLQD